MSDWTYRGVPCHDFQLPNLGQARVEEAWFKKGVDAALAANPPYVDLSHIEVYDKALDKPRLKALFKEESVFSNDEPDFQPGQRTRRQERTRSNA